MLNDNLIAVPGFNGAEEPITPQSAYGDFARTAFRPRIGASTRKPRPPPSPVLSEAEQINPQKTRRQDFFPPVLLPVRDENAVQHALQLLRDHLALPRSGAIKHQRDCAFVIGRLHSRACERSVEENFLSIPVNVHPTQPV